MRRKSWLLLLLGVVKGGECGGERAVKDRSLVRTIEVGNSYVVL